MHGWPGTLIMQKLCLTMRVGDCLLCLSSFETMPRCGMMHCLPTKKTPGTMFALTLKQDSMAMMVWVVTFPWLQLNRQKGNPVLLTSHVL